MAAATAEAAHITSPGRARRVRMAAASVGAVRSGRPRTSYTTPGECCVVLYAVGSTVSPAGCDPRAGDEPLERAGLVLWR